MDGNFPTPVASFIFCVIFLAKSPVAEHVCEVNGKTYNEGETWQEVQNHSDCFQHVCLQDGTYTSSKCDPAHNDVRDIGANSTVDPYLGEIVADSTVDTDATDKSFPTTEVTVSQSNMNGCMVDDHEVAVGVQVDVPNKCLYRACAGNDQWIMKACPLISLTSGWILTPEDGSKPYPQCCGRAKPLLDIIPDVVQNLQWSVSLKLSYDNNTVDYGNELTPSQVKAEPAVEFWADPNTRFLLSMVDPDAPSRQNHTSREFLHWLVGNIPGSNVSSGDVLAEYVGSGPPQGTGLHRYVFLLYIQPGNMLFEEQVLDNKTIEGRRKFSIQKFSEKYNLNNPIALNYFVAQYDDYVPEVHQQLGILR